MYGSSKWPCGGYELGNSVQGVQSSIAMTNRAVEAGSAINIRGVIRNGSTNTIRIIITGGDYGLFLKSGAGKAYDLTPPRATSLFMRLMGSISPGEQRTETIHVGFGKNIEPAFYTLLATRSFSSSAGGFKVESNPLKVQIK